MKISMKSEFVKSPLIARIIADTKRAERRRAARICNREPQWFYNADCRASVVDKILGRAKGAKK